MKRVILIACINLISFASAFAQFSGQLSTPKTVPDGNSRVGVYAGIYEHALGVLGQYRYGVGGYTDIGFKAGLLDLDRPRDSNAGIDMAFDLKYQAMEMRLRDPIDLSVGGVVEFLVMEDFNVLSFGGSVIGSYPIKLRNGRMLEPYGRLILRVERTAVNDFSDTDLELGLNMGTAFELSGTTKAYGELQFDERFAFFMGLDFAL